MKPARILVLASIASLALASSAFAVSPTTKYLEHYKVLRTDVPLPVKVVSPTGLPRSAKDTTITFTMVIDRDGKPHDVTPVSPVEPAVAKIMVPVVSKWRFSPAQQDGVPVARKIMLPIEVTGA